jgi:hypothetical protein
VRGLWIAARDGEDFELLPKQRLRRIRHFHPFGASGPRVVEGGIQM